MVLNEIQREMQRKTNVLLSKIQRKTQRKTMGLWAKIQRKIQRKGWQGCAVAWLDND